MSSRARRYQSRQANSPRKRTGTLRFEKLESRALLAYDVQTFDINPDLGASEEKRVVAGDYLVFPSANEQVGDEIRVVDTKTQTSVMVDLNPGRDGSNPQNLTAVGNRVFMNAYVEGEGFQVSYLDLSGPTIIHRRILVDAALSDSYAGEIGGFAVVDNKLFFTAKNQTDGFELHRADLASPNPQATYIDIDPGKGGSVPGLHGGFAVLGTKLFFNATDVMYGSALRYVDAAAANFTVNTVTSFTGAPLRKAGLAGGFQVSNSQLWFVAQDASNRQHFYWIDETTTPPVVNEVPINLGNVVVDNAFKVVDSKVFFVAEYSSRLNSTNFWFDSSTANPVLNPINSPQAGPFSGASGYSAIGTKLYFYATDSVNGYELRRIDTLDPTLTPLVYDLVPGRPDSDFGNSLVVGNRLFYVASDSTGNYKLRWVDANETNFVSHEFILDENDTLSEVHRGTKLDSVSGMLYFIANTRNDGNRLRWIDTTQPEFVASSISTMGGSQESVAGYPGGFGLVGSKLYFSAFDQNDGAELRWLDTTEQLPVIHTIPIEPGPGYGPALGHSIPGIYGGFVTVGTRLYFDAWDSVHGSELRWIDSSEATPVVHTIDLFPGVSDSRPGERGGFATAPGKLFFFANDPVFGGEIRWIDTTSDSPTIQTLDITAGSGLPSRFNDKVGLTVVGTKLFFSMLDIIYWIDTAATTIELHQVGGLTFRFNSNSKMTLAGTKLYFYADTTGGGSELCWIDTVSQSPVIESFDIATGTESSSPGFFSGMLASGNKLFFDAYDSTFGTELRWIDTTLATPVIHTVDVYPGSNRSISNSYDSNLLALVGSRLYFTGSSPRPGFQLRSLDTSTDSIVAEIIPNDSPTTLYDTGRYGGFVVAGDTLVFSASDATKGYELRVLDTGSAQPVVQTVDVERGSGSSDAGKYGGFIAVNGKLYFTGFSTGFGNELRSISLESPPIPQSFSRAIHEDEFYQFSTSDIAYSDVDGDALTSITISDLVLSPGDQLTVLRGGVETSVSDEMTLSASEISSLRYDPAADSFGQNRLTFSFIANDTETGFIPATVSIHVAPVNDSPELNTLPNIQLTTIRKGISSLQGDLVRDILGANVHDNDFPHLQGIAIVGLTAGSAGSWQFSLNNGSTWTTIPATAANNARLLPSDSQTRIRFVPSSNFLGKAIIRYRAWDQTSGVAGGIAALDSAALFGGATSFSSNVETATLSVVPKNSAPTLASSSVPLVSIMEDEFNSAGTTVGSLLAGAGDVDGDSLGIAITLASDLTRGQWQYTLNGGSNWQTLGMPSATQAFLLPADGSRNRLRFVPNPNVNGRVQLRYRAWDGTSGSALGVASVSGSSKIGGATAFSSTIVESNLSIMAVNDAPVLDSSYVGNLNSIYEDNANPIGTSIEALIGTSVIEFDFPVRRGIAISQASPQTNGIWQFTLDNGNQWLPLGTPSVAAALLLPSNGEQSRIRFVPKANYHGEVTLQFRAWDQSFGSSGGKAVLNSSSLYGGSTAFSVGLRTATLSILPVNDAPVLHSETVELGIVSNRVPAPPIDVVNLTRNRATDIDQSSALGIALISMSHVSQGAWWYSFDSGETWKLISSLNSSTSLLLPATAKLQFRPQAGFTGSATIRYRAWDSTSGQSGDRVDLTASTQRGGTRAFSELIATAVWSVTN